MAKGNDLRSGKGLLNQVFTLLQPGPPGLLGHSLDFLQNLGMGLGGCEGGPVPGEQCNPTFRIPLPAFFLGRHHRSRRSSLSRPMRSGLIQRSSDRVSRAAHSKITRSTSLDPARFFMLTESTPFQKKALELLGVSPNL